MKKDDIINKRFDRTPVGGYKIDDVNSFLQSLGEAIENKDREISELQNKLVTLAEHLEKYRNDEESMRSALLKAQKLGDSIVKDSKDKSGELVEKAVQESDAIVSKAKNEATLVKHEAKIQIEKESYELNKMKREVAKFRNHVLSLYNQQINMIEALPNEDVEELPNPKGTQENFDRVLSDKELGAPPLSSPLTSNITKRNEQEENKETLTGNNKDDKFDLKNDFKPLNFGDGFRMIEE